MSGLICRKLGEDRTEYCDHGGWLGPWLRSADCAYSNDAELAQQELGDFFRSRWARIVTDAAGLSSAPEQIYARCRYDPAVRRRVHRVRRMTNA
jgi:hypothetical protein